MAYIRSLSTRSNLLKRQYQHPLLSYILHDCEDRKEHSSIDDVSRKFSQQQRGFGSFNRNYDLSFGYIQDGRRKINEFNFCYHSPSIGSSFCRYMSSTTAVGDGSDHNIELMSDVADVVLTDPSVQHVATPIVNEVAAAAADSFFPIALLQHFIDAVHSFTGLNWWVAIVITTLIIRTATLPLLINQLKATSKLTLLRPRLEEIKQQMQDSGMDPQAVYEGQQRMSMLFKEYGVSPLTPLKGLFLQGPVFVFFFLAINNMVEKVPSFKSGGAFWFVDLSVPDSLYIFPVLTALTFWINVEFNMQEGLEGNPVAGTMKNVSRFFAAASVPLTMSFPQAIFCYWITSNIFSFAYGGALKAPGVKKFLNIPEIPVDQTSKTSQSSFSLSSALKQVMESKQKRAISSPVEAPATTLNHKISSSSVLSQKIKTLEKQVKGRRKNKRR